MGDEIVYSLWKRRVERHAAAYTTMAFRIAYFKAHHPLEFYSVFFTLRTGTVDAKTLLMPANAILSRIQELYAKRRTPKENNELTELEVVYEFKKRGFDFIRPHVLESKATQFVIKGNKLVLPFNKIAGIGTKTAITIEKARQEYGFATKKDLTENANLNKTQLKKLEDIGALEGLPDDQQMALF